MIGMNTKIIALCLMALSYIMLSFAVISLKKELKSVRLERDTISASFNQCKEDKILTHEVSNDLQNKLHRLNRHLADIKRLRDNPTCMSITVPPGQRDAGADRGKLSGQDGIRAEWLYDYAAEAEQYRLQLIGCQDFVNKVWNREK